MWQVLRGSLEQEACSWIVGWVGQSGVLAPWGVTVVAAPGPLGHLASICDVGVNLILSYFFIYLEYLYRLTQFGFEKQVYIASINDNKARWPCWEPYSLLFVEVYEFFYSLTLKIWLLIYSPLSSCCIFAYSSVMRTFLWDQKKESSTWLVWIFSSPVCWIMCGSYREKLHVDPIRELKG